MYRHPLLINCNKCATLMQEIIGETVDREGKYVGMRVCAQSLCCVQLLVTLWTVACQPPLFMRFSRQEYWSGLPCPPPGDLSDSGIEPMPLTSPALAGRFFIPSATWETPQGHYSWPFQIYSLMYSITNKTQLLFHQNCAVFPITILCIFC